MRRRLLAKWFRRWLMNWLHDELHADVLLILRHHHVPVREYDA